MKGKGCGSRLPWSAGDWPVDKGFPAPLGGEGRAGQASVLPDGDSGRQETAVFVTHPVDHHPGCGVLGCREV